MDYKIIDLTHDIENGMIKFSADWHIDTKIEKLGTIDTVGRNTKKVLIGSHSGTHMDAPLHFINNGISIEQLSLNLLVGKVTIIDLSFMKKNEPITIELLKKYNYNDKVLFKFGWASKWNTKDFYCDYPYFTEESAEFLIEKGVKVVGLDTPSPDYSHTKLLSQEDSKIHKIFLKQGIILIEYLNLNNVVDYEDWTLIALPMKLKGSDGAPSRVILIKEIKNKGE